MQVTKRFYKIIAAAGISFQILAGPGLQAQNNFGENVGKNSAQGGRLFDKYQTLIRIPAIASGSANDGCFLSSARKRPAISIQNPQNQPTSLGLLSDRTLSNRQIRTGSSRIMITQGYACDYVSTLNGFTFLSTNPPVKHPVPLTLHLRNELQHCFAPVAANHYTDSFGFFCRQELKIEKATSIPFRFRLGSLAACNAIEGK